MLPALVDRAEALARSPRDLDDRLAAAAFALHWMIWTGDYHRGRELCATFGSAWAAGSPISWIPLAIWRSVVLWDQADHRSAKIQLEEVLAIANRSGVHVYDWGAHAWLAEVALSAGDHEAAMRSVDDAWPLARPAGSAEYVHVRMLRAFVLAAKGQMRDALQAMRDAAHGFDTEHGSPFLTLMHATGSGHLLMRNDSHRESREYFDRALAMASRIPSPNFECYALLGLSWSHFSTGEADVGLRHLRSAFAIGARHNYKNAWPWVPHVMSDLCAHALAAGVEPEYAKSLIHHRGLLPPSPSVEVWPWPVKIFTLGRFSVLVDGEPLQFPRKAQKKPLDLLKAVIAQGGRGVDHTALVDELWPDLDGDAGRNALDLALHRLRKLLGCDEAIAVQASKVTIDARRVWVDAWAFERTCGEITRSSEPMVGSAVTARIERVLRLYIGPFLRGEHEPWAIAARDRMRSKLLRTVGTLGRALERCGAWEEAIELYRRAIELDPLAEEFHRGIMEAYREQERIGDALTAYRRCRELLQESLGVEPSARTRAIYQSLMQSHGGGNDARRGLRS
jgi:DNA-binding SARP family transcriptional activator